MLPAQTRPIHWNVSPPQPHALAWETPAQLSKCSWNVTSSLTLAWTRLQVSFQEGSAWPVHTFPDTTTVPPLQLLAHSLPVVCHVSVTPIGWSALPLSPLCPANNSPMLSNSSLGWSCLIHFTDGAIWIFACLLIYCFRFLFIFLVTSYFICLLMIVLVK